MKRQSQAEAAIAAKIKIVKCAIDECDFQAKFLTDRRKTLFNLRVQFEDDLARRRKAREVASERNKP